MYMVIKYIVNLNISINLFLEDVVFSMLYTKFLLRYYIGGTINFASEFYKIIKNPNHPNYKWVSGILSIFKNKTTEEVHDCEHCDNVTCDENTYKTSEKEIKREEIKPESVDIVEPVEVKVKPIFNSEIINDDIFMRYTTDEIREARRISASPENENDIDKIYKTINITEDILSTLQDKEINYKNIGKLNKLTDKVNKLYNRAKELEKELHIKRKREVAESIMDDLLKDDVVNK